MQATQILMVDHEEAKTMLDTLVDGDFSANDSAVFSRLKEALQLHTEVEEKIFYPALTDFPETKEIVAESYEEHDEVKRLLNSMVPGNDAWDDQIVELRSKVLHHAEEEEHELFPEAEALLGAETLVELGREIQAMKSGRQPVSTAGAARK